MNVEAVATKMPEIKTAQLTAAKFPFPKLTLRLKILGLVTASVGISVFSSISIGTKLITEDKLSYIYDYNMIRVAALGDRIDSQVRDTLVLAKSMGSSLGETSSLAARYGNSETYKRIQGILFLKVKEGRFEIINQQGADADRLKLALATQGWNPDKLARADYLVGQADSSGIDLASTTTDSQGAPLAFILRIKLDSPPAESRGDIQLFVVDPTTQSVALTPASQANGVTAKDAVKFGQSVLSTNFPAGIQTLAAGGHDYIAGYQRILGQKLLALGFVRKDLAFSATTALTRRTAALGFSVLMITLGICLIFVQKLTVKLKQLHKATTGISQGDFSARVDTSGITDEVTSLARSFNTMADKIDDLMVQTAHKSRMELELKTAQIVQGRYFPTTDFKSPTFSLAGRCAPASECSGDWWQNAQIGQKLFVFVGDVTGHGASAALVTSAAYATFVNWIKFHRLNTQIAPTLESLLDQLNDSVLSASGGESGMTFVANLIDLDTNALTFCLGGHPPPYLHRPGFVPEGNSASGPFIPLLGEVSNSLGDTADYHPLFHTQQLHPGDHLFWYTDGVFEKRRDDQQINKRKFLKMAANSALLDPYGATGPCEKLMEEILEFHSKSAEERPDDITVIVASVPKATT